MNKSKTIKNKANNKYSKKYRKNVKSKSNKCKTMKSIMYEFQKIQKMTEEVRVNNLKLNKNDTQNKNDKQNKNEQNKNKQNKNDTQNKNKQNKNKQK